MLQYPVSPRQAVIVVGLLVVVVAGPIGALASAGTGSAGDSVSAEGDEGLVLEPHSGPNGNYASIENGKLELNLERLNDNSNSEFDEVFTITADRDLEAVWIADPPEGAHFYLDDDPQAAIDESTPVTLESSESIDVGVAVDTRDTDGGNETFTVHAEYEDDEDAGPDRPSAAIDLEDVTYSSADLEAGENLTVTATYENHGDAVGRTTTDLVVDGVVVDSKTVTVGAGERKEVTFTRTMDRVGTFDVGVGDGEPASITVSAGEKAALNVTDVEIEDAELEAGGSTTIAATVVNEGNATGRLTPELAIDGVVVDDLTVELEPGEERTVTFDRRFDEPRRYAVSVSGTDGGSVTVLESDPPAVVNRVFASSSTAAVAPPTALGLAAFARVAYNRRKV